MKDKQVDNVWTETVGKQASQKIYSYMLVETEKLKQKGTQDILLVHNIMTFIKVGSIFTNKFFGEKKHYGGGYYGLLHLEPVS